MKALSALGAAILLAACQPEAAAPTPEPTQPTVRLPIVPGRPGAAYFELRDAGNRGALVSVTSPQIGRIEMHETMTHGTMSSMRPLTRVAAEDGVIAFRPGGKHLMLYRVDPALAAGGEAELVLHFENGSTQALRARVEAAGVQSH